MAEQPASPDDRAALRCRSLTRRFGDVVAVDSLDLAVHEGELLALLGPSGCGKTTALRMIAGLEHPDGGSIEIRGSVVAGKGPPVPPERRRVGMVFQEHALFTHLDVRANVGYGLPRKAADRDAKIDAALQLVGLPDHGARRPSQLSGGQQQRVALARALAPGPDLVLLDEPFSNLDASLREQVRAEVRDILRRAGATAVIVTHDQQEALSLADRVAVMNAGRLHQLATPAELYLRPATEFVAGFVGDADVLDGIRAGRFLLDTPLGRLSSRSPLEVDHHAAVVRPESLELSSIGEPNATVMTTTYFGHDQLVELRLDTGPTLRARTAPTLHVAAGDRIKAGVSAKVVTFPR